MLGNIFLIFLAVFIVMLIIGLCAGCITALIIRHSNKKSVVTANKSYSEKDRKQFQIDQETLLQGKNDYAAQDFK